MKRLMYMTALFWGFVIIPNVWADVETPSEEVSDEMSLNEMDDDLNDGLLEEIPEDCSCEDCYEKIVKYKRCYYKEWVCKTEQVSYETKHTRWIPQYYEKLRCKYVPQYYYETFCRYVPEDYSTYDTYDVPKYECVTRCKFVPKVYFKKKECTICDER